MKALKTRQVLGIAFSFLLLAAATPAYAGQECSCENGQSVHTKSDDPADCDDACADLVGSRGANRRQQSGGDSADRNPTPDPDEVQDPNPLP